MKRHKIVILLLFIFFLSPLLSAVNVSATVKSNSGDVEWPSGPSVTAEGAIVMEASTGLILYEKNINTQYYPASITKIMTSLLAIENSSLGEVVNFSKNAVFDIDIDSSRIGIDVGEQITMQQSLYGILLESANEVSYAVAEHIAGSKAAFGEMMTKRAKELGCLNTNFTNPHGLHDEDHYTTPYDMALITREAMKNETFRKIFGSRTYQIPPTNIQEETRYLRNHHKFVMGQTKKYEGCIGGKTGYTGRARYTLVTVAKRGDLELISVVMKSDSPDSQYEDTRRLLDYGFDNFSIYPIAELEESTEILNESPMFTRYNYLLSGTETPIITDEKGYLVLPNTASFEDAVKEVNFYSSDERNDNDNVIGKISYTYMDKYVGGANILYNKVEKPTLTHMAANPYKPTTAPDIITPEESDGSLRPIIIASIVGVLVLMVILYFIFVERPRLKRRKAYYKRRANRRRYQDNDYLDL